MSLSCAKITWGQALGHTQRSLSKAPRGQHLPHTLSGLQVLSTTLFPPPSPSQGSPCPSSTLVPAPDGPP